MGFDTNSDLSSDENILSKVKALVPNVNTEKKIYKCDFLNCNKEFSRPSKLKRHQCVHTQVKLLTCTYANCNKKYNYSWHLKRHINNVHEKTYEQKFKCIHDECAQEFTSEFSLRRHIKHIHSEGSPTLKKYSCNHCSQGFRKKNQLATHIITHTGDQTISCKDCNIVFENIADFKKHLSRHKTFTCDCGETFHRWTKFMSHKRTKHITTYECDVCSKVFRTKVYLKQHKQIHNNSDLRKVYECTHSGCPKYYYHPQNLSHHIKSYHSAERFSCTFKDCDRRFVTNQKLKTHMKVHDPNWVPRSQKRKPQKPRKDIGIPKKSMAVHLAGYLQGAEIKMDENVESPTDEDDIISHKDLKVAGCPAVLNIVSKDISLSDIVSC